MTMISGVTLLGNKICRRIKNYIFLFIFLLGFHVFAGSDISKEPFESLENIYGDVSLFNEIVKEGKYSLKFSGTIDKSKGGGVNFYKKFKTPVDLSGYSFLSLWVYPDSEDGTYSVELRMVVKSEGKISWLHIGTINPSNAPNRKWTQLTFDISEIPRKEVLRVFDIVAWNNSGEYTDKERVIFYFDDLEFFTAQQIKERKKLITLANESFSISISSLDGKIYSLKSLKPSSKELLVDRGALGVYGISQNGELFEFDLKEFKIIENNQNPIGIKAVLERKGVKAEFLCKLEKEEGLVSINLKLKQVVKEGVPLRLIFLGQPGLPFNNEELYAFPYSEGIVSTGTNKYLRLGRPSWEAKVHTKEEFTPPCTIEASLIINRGGAGLIYASQPNGAGYWITFREGKMVTCWKNNGRWVTEGKGLGSRPFIYENGKKYKIKIEGSKEGFTVFIDNQKLFDIQDTEFTQGNLGLFTGWLGVASFDDIKVIKEGRVVFEDDFSSYPIGSEAEPNWTPFSGVGWVPGYISVEDGGNEWGGYPARFVDLSDRYLVWGQFDLAHPVVLHKIETSSPWMGVTHLPQNGDVYSLDIFIKSFPKIDFARRDIIRWYAQHMYSSDPFFPPEEPRLKHEITRTLPDGNTLWYLWGYLGYLKKCSQAPECLIRAEERAKDLFFRNVVLMDWYSLGEGERVSSDFPGAHLQLTTGKMYFGKRLKGEIERLQKAGFKVYLYFWPITLAFNPRDEVKMNRFINFIKESVKFYEPDGVGYDMNWDVHKEILKLQYEIYRWLNEKYPGSKVIIDYGFGTASELYADALLCENTPPAYGFPENPVVEATTALRATLLNLIYYQEKARVLEEKGKLEEWGWGINKPVDSLEQHKSIYLELVLKSLSLGSPWMAEIGNFFTPEGSEEWQKIMGRKMYPFPELMKLTELAYFSALATGTPLVTETKTISCHPDVVASCWAGKKRLLIAAYRYKMSWHPETGFWSPKEEATSKLIWLEIKLDGLKKYGLDKLPRLELIILDKSGLPVKSAFKVESEDLAIKYPIGSLETSTLPPFKIEIKEDMLKITGYMEKDEMLLVYPAEK